MAFNDCLNEVSRRVETMNLDNAFIFLYYEILLLSLLNTFDHRENQRGCEKSQRAV